MHNKKALLDKSLQFNIEREREREGGGGRQRERATNVVKQ
jgi:hypothetical protein